MKASAHTRVKVCCMKSIDEMWMAIEAGASARGPRLADAERTRADLEREGG